MKKLLLILVLLVFCPLFCTAEEEPEKYTSGAYTYTLLEDGTAEIIRYTGSAKSLEIPEKLDGYTVSSIGDGAFKLTIFMTEITIPDSIIRMGSNPFAYGMSLSKIHVSPRNPSFAVIDDVLFDKSTKTLICYPSTLTSSVYVIPDGIKAIGADAFTSCRKLTKVVIPDGVVSIGDHAFYCCESLSDIVLPDSIEVIEGGAFSCCESLTKIIVPDNVTSIEKLVFNECTSLSEITLPDGITSIGE